MSNRCPGCNRFPSYEAGDPESNLEVDDEGRITGEVRITLISSCCSEEMREATLDVDLQVEVPKNAVHVDTTKSNNDCKECQHAVCAHGVDCGKDNKPTIVPHPPADHILGVHDNAIPPPSELSKMTGGKLDDSPGFIIAGPNAITLPDIDHIHELTIEDDHAEATDRFTGKGRGQKHFHGATVSGTVMCLGCDWETEFTWEGDVQFSSMDECS